MIDPQKLEYQPTNNNNQSTNTNPNSIENLYWQNFPEMSFLSPVINQLPFMQNFPSTNQQTAQQSQQQPSTQSQQQPSPYFAATDWSGPSGQQSQLNLTGGFNRKNSDQQIG